MDQSAIDYDFETMLYDANLMVCSPELLDKLEWITDEYVKTLVGYNISGREDTEKIVTDIRVLINKGLIRLLTDYNNFGII